MKKLFVCALAASMFTACSQDETISQQSPMQISFDGAFVENASRAIDPSFHNTNNPLNAFDVWGFMDESTGSLWDDVATGEDVNKTDAGWNYVNTAYWFAGHTYYFAALAPQNSGNIAKNYERQPWRSSICDSIKYKRYLFEWIEQIPLFMYGKLP